jgi:hypothetical protein
VHFITTQTNTDVYMPAISVLQQLLVHVTLHCTNDCNTNHYNIFVLPRPSQVLIQYGPMHWLKGTYVVHYFNDKRVIPPWVFNYLLAWIRHDDIVQKIDTAGFRILILADFYVSPIPTYTIAQPLLNSPYITNISSQQCTNLSSTHQKIVTPIHRPWRCMASGI